MRCKTVIAVFVVALMFDSTVSWAQEMKKDSVWNGVVTGAGVGAAVGVVVAETGDDVCSIPTCMALFAVAGSAVGLVIDKSIGRPRPLEPGEAVDDRLANGVFVGAGVVSTVVLIDFASICRAPRGCTVEGVVRAVLRGAVFGGALGALVDAAIPSRAGAATSGGRAAAPRQVSVRFDLRF